MTLIDKVWAVFCNMKFKEYIIGLLVLKYQRLDRRINIFLAIASSTRMNIQRGAPIIAASQLIMTLKPYFPYTKIIHELNSRCLKMDLLNIEYERFWNRIQRGKLSEETIEQYYFDHHKSYAEVLNFPDDMVFDTSASIEAKATARMKNFLKTFYGIIS